MPPITIDVDVDRLRMNPNRDVATARSELDTEDCKAMRGG